MTALEGKALLDHGKMIARRYAGRVGPDVAEELRAEAVLRALGSPPPDGRMEPWLERIYRNLFVDLWRRGQLLTVNLDDVPALAGAGTPEEEVLHRERRRLVRASLGRLPREARRALLSRYYGELDDAAAAARFGVAAATVRTRIHRALARLRLRLGDLRALCPPMFGKLAAQTAALGLAPTMVAVLVVVGVSARAPAPTTAPPVTNAIVHHTALAQARPTARIDTPAAPAVPQPRVRMAKKATVMTPAAVPAPSPPAEVVELGEEEPVIGEILQPEAVDIFADPAQPESPCLVEAPPSFMAQIEKMVEESL